VNRKRITRTLQWFALALAVLLAGSWLYVRTHPLVFLDAHRHCIKCAGLQLVVYAADHNGRFPYHPKGYGNALLQMNEDSFFAFTGPGYDDAPFHAAKAAGRELAEDECGRVYVQGLSTQNDPELALLFDKLATPGGDHCHLPCRIWAPLGREVWTVGGMHLFVRESEWPEFARKQARMLTDAGFSAEQAERLYQPNTRPRESE
jgi:hypothetical protein